MVTVAGLFLLITSSIVQYLFFLYVTHKPTILSHKAWHLPLICSSYAVRNNSFLISWFFKDIKANELCVKEEMFAHIKC